MSDRIWNLVQNQTRNGCQNKKVVWDKSLAFKCFVAALKVDPLAAERERIGLPAFASNLGLLEPLRSETPGTSSSPLFLSNQMPSSNDQMTANVPPTSTCTSMSQLDLDFLESSNNSSNNVIKERKRDPFEDEDDIVINSCPVRCDQVLEDLLSNAHLSAIPSSQGIKSTEGSNCLIANSLSTQPSNHNHSNNNQDQSNILDQLPLLSFPGSNISSIFSKNK